MFGFGGQEIFVIALIILILFGVKRLPEIGAGLGKTLREIRKIREERGESGEAKKAAPEETLLSGLKKEAEQIPGMKEVREIRKAAGEIKRISKVTRFLR